MELIYFDSFVDSYYPVGRNISKNIPYIEACAKNINKLINKDRRICLICRGTSGTIISSSVAYILRTMNREVTIIISRKNDKHHSFNMEGVGHLYTYEAAASVVIDDFISSGATLNHIINDLKEEGADMPYDLLCISNNLDIENLNSKIEISKKEDRILLYENLHKFKQVLCNKPLKHSNHDVP